LVFSVDGYERCGVHKHVARLRYLTFDAKAGDPSPLVRPNRQRRELRLLVRRYLNFGPPWTEEPANS
jgi:hypothetical protein